MQIMTFNLIPSPIVQSTYIDRYMYIFRKNIFVNGAFNNTLYTELIFFKKNIEFKLRSLDTSKPADIFFFYQLFELKIK